MSDAGVVVRPSVVSMESLYAALNCRRLAAAHTSESGAPLGAVGAVETALAVPAPAASTATIDETIFSFFLLDIVRLPFEGRCLTSQWHKRLVSGYRRPESPTGKEALDGSEKASSGESLTI